MSRWPLSLAAGLALTCARPGPDAARAESSPPRVLPARALASARPATASAHAGPEPAPPSAPSASGPLAPFFTALRQLEQKTRQAHVRVLWLGDSHTAADFLSGAVRTALADRFGDGGPGFVRIGTRPYRHDGLRVVRDGRWNVDPDPLARRSLQADGVFGFAGSRAEPLGGASFLVELRRPQAPGADDAASFELSYTLPGSASFQVRLGERLLVVDESTQGERSPSGISHLKLSAPLKTPIVLLPRSGRPRLFGLILEREGAPGVVLDTAGINGARLETPLSWNEPAFVAEVARRAPELFVLSYGTNEAFDAASVERYGGHLARLVERMRAGAPRASCLVLGATDAPLEEGSVPRVAQVNGVLQGAAQAAGCSFVSLQELMGGEGSFARGMKAKERLCQPDKLHLTPRGYLELGQALAQRLLEAYSAGRGDLVAPLAAAAGSPPH